MTLRCLFVGVCVSDVCAKVSTCIPHVAVEVKGQPGYGVCLPAGLRRGLTG